VKSEIRKTLTRVASTPFTPAFTAVEDQALRVKGAAEPDIRANLATLVEKK
jgi:hypothetical protein